MSQQNEKNSNISIIFDKQINVDLPTSYIIEIDKPENKKNTLNNDQLSKSGEILIKEKASKFITTRLKTGGVVGAPLCFCPEITACFTGKLFSKFFTQIGMNLMLKFPLNALAQFS